MSDPRFYSFSVLALKNNEHTWGGDQKVAIQPYVSSNWTNADLMRMQATQLVQNYTSSWVQQRNMGIRDAISALADHPLAATIQSEISALQKPVEANTTGWKVYTPPSLPATITIGSFQFSINSSTGAVQGLSVSGWGKVTGPFGDLQYQTYTGSDYDDFRNNYNYGFEHVVFVWLFVALFLIAILLQGSLWM